LVDLFQPDNKLSKVPKVVGSVLCLYRVLLSVTVSGERKAEGRRQKVSHCGGRVPRHKASGEPEGQKDEFIFPFVPLHLCTPISPAPLHPCTPAPYTKICKLEV
jgi:hypothetical protein